MAIVNRYSRGNRYTPDQLRICKNQKAITYSGADVVIKNVDADAVWVEYLDAVENKLGHSWIDYRNVFTVPWFEMFKDTKLGKLLVS